MDLSSLKDQVSNLTLYDLKAGVRKVQNAVMNYTEMESKVREATNNEPWGASSTLMQEIANATHSYHLLGEIMPMIYKRFTEKSAEEWRQIYKGLQLLEFLVKNGSERVIDDARSHMSLLKMLRQFHFIDQNGKDQGVNVRNRSKELTELLSDVDRIRAERKKARSNRNKFGGVEGGAMSGGMSSGSGGRYGGFGSESGGYGGYSGGVYGDGGGFGGNTSEFQDSSSRRDKFEEYDEYDEGTTSSSARRKPESSAAAARRDTQKPEPPKKKEPEIDILSFDADDIPPKTPPKDFASNGKKASSNPMDDGFGSLQAGGVNEEDDFDDFQSAAPSTQSTSKTPIPSLSLPPNPTTSTAQFAAPKPISGSQNANLDSLVGFNAISPTPSITSPPLSTFTASPPPPPPSSAFASPAPLTTQQQQPHNPTGYRAAQPNYYTSVQVQSTAPSTSSSSKPSLASSSSFGMTNNTSAKPKPTGASSGDAFSSLWSTASSSAGIKKTDTLGGNKGPNLATMAKEKTSQGIWGPSANTAAATPAAGVAPQSNGGQHQKVGGGLDDLLG
ncbi:MAG: hypothetical protein Q9222_000248 [Ikaeria aurantiellina]